MLGTLNENSLIAHLCSNRAYLVIVYQIRVTYYLWCLTEKFLHAFCLTLNLVLETFFVAQRTQTMAIWLCHELSLTGLGNLRQQINHFRSILLKHLYCNSRERECRTERSVSLTHLQNSVQRRNVATLCSLANGTLVLIIIIIIVILADIKETISLQVHWLMYLEIQTNLFHCFI